MANNYSACTVWPVFPESACTPVFRELLSDVGFDMTLDTEARTYCLYAEGPIEDDPFWPYDGDGGTEGKYDQHPTCPMEQEIVNAWAAGEPCPHDWMDVLQEMARRAGIPEVEVAAAFWCDKMRPGEFGGWVVRITPDTVQSGSTDTLLFRMREDPAYCALRPAQPRAGAFDGDPWG